MSKYNAIRATGRQKEDLHFYSYQGSEKVEFIEDFPPEICDIFQ
jgi:hypothetical protein